MKSKKKKLKTQDYRGKIPGKALTVEVQAEKLKYPVFSFLHASDTHCVLSEWQSSEIDELVNTLKIIEQVSWDDLWKHKGLDLTKIPVMQLKVPLPSCVSEDETIYEFSVCTEKRIFGYRTNHNVFRIIWFDRKHEVLPYHKVKRG